VADSFAYAFPALRSMLYQVLAAFLKGPYDLPAAARQRLG
jgi:hypothetical protein